MANFNPPPGNYVLGRGKLFFAEKKANGTLGGERFIGNVTAFNLSITAESAKHYDMTGGVKEQNRDVPVSTDRSATFTTDEVSPANLALMFLGSASAVSVGSAAGQSETFNAVEQGLTYQVGISTANPAGIQKIASVVVKVGSTAKTLGTDYTVDTDTGRVYIVPGGTITDGANITVEYDRLASTQTRTVSASTVKEGAMRFMADNPEGVDTDYYMPDVKVYPNGDFAVLTDTDWSNQQFNVGIQRPADGRPAISANQRAVTA